MTPLTRFLAFCTVAFVTLLNSNVHAEDFRSASWGMSLAEVKALHPDELAADQRANEVAYDGILAGLDVLIFYQFDEFDRLFKAGYRIQADAEAATGTFITEYNDLNELLRQKYPDSMQPQKVWQNRTFADKPEKWARAVMVGQLSYAWHYSTPRTRIDHTLNGTRRAISHRLVYEEIPHQTDEDTLNQL